MKTSELWTKKMGSIGKDKEGQQQLKNDENELGLI